MRHSISAPFSVGFSPLQRCQAPSLVSAPSGQPPREPSGLELIDGVRPLEKWIGDLGLRVWDSWSPESGARAPPRR